MKLENNKCLTKSTDSLNKPKETEMSSKEFSQNKRSKEKLSLKLKEKDKLCSRCMLMRSENRSCKMMRLQNKQRLKKMKKDENLNKDFRMRKNFLNTSKV